MGNKLNSNEEKMCNCKNIPSIIHELSQSLVVIHAYVKGCSERLKRGDTDKEQIINHLETVNKQIHLIGQKIHELS